MTQLTFGVCERQRAFEEFHAANPSVWDLFERFTLRALEARARAGDSKRIGARFVWERMRWFIRFETTDVDFKLNDHYPPFYARMFMKAHPEHGVVFETRDRKG